ncbi:MAG: N-acetyltransferase [Alphaproteobacteria bacterium]|nr:MAG: N-acetyltransferase [Alphaproteobacteria bacterium]
MTPSDFTIEPESPCDERAISALCARAFGPGRFARTAYRIRENALPADGLGLVARNGTKLAGSVRFTPVSIGAMKDGLLLGPLVVAPEFAGKGCGRRLVAEGVEAARAAGYRLVLLVGDLSYYGGLGFRPVPAGRIVFPGPVDPARLLALELDAGALEEARGLLRPAAASRAGGA